MQESIMKKIVAKTPEEKMADLKKAYEQADKDPDRLETIKEWESTDAEGWKSNF